MMDRADTFMHGIRLLFGSLLIIASLFLISVLLVAIKSNSASASDSSISLMSQHSTDDPNVVTNGLGAALSEFGQAMSTVGSELAESTQSVTAAIAESTKSIASGAQSGATTTARTVGDGLSYAGSAAADGVVLALKAPGNVLEFVAESPAVSAVIRPSDSMDVPIIDPQSPDLQKALATLPPTAQTNNATPAWPVHGAVTTQFGVPHWPYQRTHSGLDIADGQRSGTTPIHPFRPGRVIETISSNRGLGNHVILDHGNGITSVYAHMASISVHVGQDVGMDAVLGYIGSTGASTGPHLHFEIRINGQATDPHPFISGQP